MASSSLDKLSNHSIFQNTTRGPESHSQGDLSKIASRGGDELFIAHGRNIRCCDLNSKKDNYKLLKVSDIGFGIAKLQINDSGTLLAAYNEDELVVYSLPAPGFMENFKENSIPVKSYHVGKSYKAKIVDLCWSSIARFDSELVLLFDDNYVRTFDLTISSEVAQFELDLAHNSTGFGLTANINDPISMCFGSKSQKNPAECLTLYILSGEGDVFALYPFTPNCLSVTANFVKKLFDQTTISVKTAESDAKRSNLLHQLTYVSALYKNLDKAQKEIKVGLDGTVEELHHLPAPNLKNRKLKLQGPFGIAPFPSVLYNFDSIEIANVPCGDSDLIVILWSNGGCLLVVQDQELTMGWHSIEFALDDSEDEQAELTLSTVEYISLTRNVPLLAKIAGSSSAVPYAFFVVLGQSKLIRIDFSSWGEVLNESIKTGDAQKFISLMSSGVSSELTLLSQEQDFEGFTVLDAGSSTHIIKLGAFNVEVIEVKKSQEEEEEEEEEERIILQSENLRKKSTFPLPAEQYQSLLAAPYEELTNLIKQAKTPSKPPPPNTNPNAPLSMDDESSLQDLLQLSNFVLRKKMTGLHKLGVNLHARIASQRKELKGQVAVIANEFSEEGVEAKQSRTKDLKKRLEDSISKQSTAVTRLDALLSKLKAALEEQRSKNKNQVISKEEQAWFKQIELFERQASNLRGKYTDYKEQLRYINGIVLTSGALAANMANLNQQSLKQIKSRLTKEKKLVNYVKSSLTDDINEIDKSLGVIALN